MGDWCSAEDFRDDLDRLRCVNIGSRMYPVYMYETCDCDEDETAYPYNTGGV
jgi:hypothetical protein